MFDDRDENIYFNIIIIGYSRMESIFIYILNVIGLVDVQQDSNIISYEYNWI